MGVFIKTILTYKELALPLFVLLFSFLVIVILRNIREEPIFSERTFVDTAKLLGIDLTTVALALDLFGFLDAETLVDRTYIVFLFIHFILLLICARFLFKVGKRNLDNLIGVPRVSIIESLAFVLSKPFLLSYKDVFGSAIFGTFSLATTPYFLTRIALSGG